MSNQPKKFNKFVATAAGVAVVASAVAPAAGAAWTNSPDWMKDSLQDLVNYGVIDADSNLSATGEVTRGEVALYFARALKLDLENVKNPNFADVSTSHKYYNAIAALAAADKMNGTDKGFEPDRVINRAEMASLIVKAFGYEYGNGASLKFTDLKGSEWAKNAIAALVDANIVSGVNQAQTLFAPTEKLTRQDTAAFLHKTMKAKGIEFAVEVEKEVSSVNAVTTKGVEVVFEKVTKAREDVMITVTNPSGEVVAVNPVNLEIGDTEITFTFEKELAEVELGTWVVGGVEFDTAAVAAVEEVLNANNQVELYNALKSSYFKNVKADSITDYEKAIGTADSEDKDTVAKIQKIINDVNSNVVSLADKAEAVEEVKEAKNQLQLLDALKNFDRVNSEWISNYETQVKGLTLDNDDAKAYDQIQVAIDAVNKTNVVTAIEDAEKNIDSTKVTTARNLVKSYIEEDDKENNDTEKADYLTRLDLQQAVINVTVANTNAKLTNALTALAELDEVNFDIDTVNSVNLKAYRDEIALTKNEDKNSVADVKTIINKVNTAQENAAVLAVAKVAATIADADLKTLLTDLDAKSANFDIDFVIDGLLNQYSDAINAAYTADATTVDTAAEIEGIILNVNDPSSALQAIDDATTDAELLTALKSINLNLKNVVDANKVQYHADLDAFKLAADAADDKTAANVKKLVDAVNAIASLNAATNADAAKTALVNFAMATNDTDFVNLTSTAKLEVAELVLEDKATGYANVAAVSAKIDAEIIVHSGLVAAVNDAADTTPTINKVYTALLAINYDEFKDLSDAQQLEVAELFMKAYPVDKDGKLVADNYKTLTAIKADIDKAIDAIN